MTPAAQEVRRADRREAPGAAACHPAPSQGKAEGGRNSAPAVGGHGHAVQQEATEARRSPGC
eukprot:2215062-Pyramimonas_sp.AAC.1